MKRKLNYAVIFLLLIATFSCKSKTKKDETKPPVIYSGLYSYGPEVKSFKDCADGHEYWVADSSAVLELTYSQQNFEKPYEPVYVEVEAHKIKSGQDGTGAEFDSTMVVTKMVKLTKEIPNNCN